MRTCPDCGVDISDRHRAAKRCFMCAKAQHDKHTRDAQRRNRSGGYKYEYPIQDRICLVCDEPVRHTLPDARICKRCHDITTEHCGSLADGATGHMVHHREDAFTRDERLRMGAGSPDSCILEYPDVFDDMDLPTDHSLNFYGGE